MGLSNWFVKFELEMTPKSVLSSLPLTEVVGVNWEPVSELAGEAEPGSAGGSDFNVSICP